jgi:hypothetical protein
MTNCGSPQYDRRSASNWLRKTLNSCTASCVKFMVVLPQIASSTSPPSMIVVKPFR